MDKKLSGQEDEKNELLTRIDKVESEIITIEETIDKIVSLLEKLVGRLQGGK